MLNEPLTKEKPRVLRLLINVMDGDARTTALKVDRAGVFTYAEGWDAARVVWEMQKQLLWDESLRVVDYDGGFCAVTRERSEANPLASGKDAATFLTALAESRADLVERAAAECGNCHSIIGTAIVLSSDKRH